MTSDPTRLDRLQALALGVGFLLLISLPMADNFFMLDSVEPRMEFRPLTDWTHVSAALDAGPVATRDALRNLTKDRFGFRDLLVQTGAEISVYGLATSSQSSVLLGRDGWMFLAGDGALVSYRGLRPLPDAASRRIVNVFARRAAWLAERDIHYVLVVVPNKHSIYPEHLPQDLPEPRVPSRLDQLLAGLSRRGVVAVDLRPELLAAKQSERIYYPLDAHWNPAGAFVGYRALAKPLRQWFPDWRPLERSEFETRERPVDGDVASLPRMLGLPLDPDWRATVLVPGAEREPLRAVTPEGEPFAGPVHGGVGSTFGSLRVGTTGPRTFVLRDSFANQMLTYLSESLPEVVYAWPEIPTRVRTQDRERIDRERPELVIQLFSERTLEWGLAGLRPFDAIHQQDH